MKPANDAPVASDMPAIDWPISACVGSLESLQRGIPDDRLDRGHLKVLNYLCKCLNGLTMTAWPSRARIAAEVGMDEKSACNKLYELRRWGYVTWERQPDPSRSVGV